MNLPSPAPAVIEFHGQEGPTGNGGLFASASPQASNGQAGPADPTPLPFTNYAPKVRRIRPTDIPIPPSRGYPKAAFRIRMAVDNLIEYAGCDTVLFSTLTFRRAPTHPETIVRRLRAILAALRKFYPGLEYIWVLGRFASGGLHVHAVFAVRQDVVTGTDMDLCGRLGVTPAQSRAALNEAGQLFWTRLARIGRSHGLGIFTLFPVCTNAEAIGVYLSQNFWEFQKSRRLSDFRRRAWGTSRGFPPPPPPAAFSLNREGNVRHRQRLAEAALRLYGIRDLDGARRILGPRWHFDLCRDIYQRERESSGAVPSAAPTPKGGAASWAGYPDDGTARHGGIAA